MEMTDGHNEISVLPFLFIYDRIFQVGLLGMLKTADEFHIKDH